ncbi:MAG: response regulator transcription factor [Candidatus Polarisedimenticolia bacterium]|nr:response regulator transcription factor [bacterium]
MTEQAKPVRVLCVDDHPLVRKGVAAILAAEPDMVLVAEAADGESALAAYREHRPDVVLMDLRLPGADGIETTARIRAEHPEARVIVLTSYSGDQDIYRALEAGVRGYLLKEMVHTDVVRAIRAAMAGKRFLPPEVSQKLGEFLPDTALTPREIEVVTLVAKGLANKEIAAQLGTSEGTIKVHVQNILRRLDARDRTHAVTIAVRRGIVHLP